jgi:preprotein translocase subunit SecA
LVTLEHLRNVVGLRAYGQRDPVNEYKQDAFNLFDTMLERLREAVTGQLMHVELAPDEPLPIDMPDLPPMEAHHIDPLTGEDEFALADGAAGNGSRSAQAQRRKSAVDPNDPSTWGRVSRNDKCPCGSGKKFKHCHGKLS